MNKKKIIVIGVIILVVVGLIIGIVIFRSNDSEDYGIEENYSIDYEEEIEDKEEKKEYELISIGKELYSSAINMYYISPYCGIDYDDIDEDELISKNGMSYYKTKYSSVDDISKEVNKVFKNNPFGKVTDSFIKDGKVYCKYSKAINTSKFLREYSLDVVNSSNSVIQFTVTTLHIKDVHGEFCSLNDPMECHSDDKVKQTSRFVIEKVNGEWKIKEFNNPYASSSGF